MDSSSRKIEEGWLLKSHSQEETDELLDSRYSLSGEQKPFLVLTPTTGNDNNTSKRGRKKVKTPQHPDLRINQKQQTNKIKRARDDLKDFIQKNKNNCSYEKFVPLNELWNDYIKDLLSNDKKNMIPAKLASADYHGAILSVSESRNPSLVGVTGIVIWEARTSFVFVNKDNKLRIVEKRGSKFKVMNIPGLSTSSFEIIGSRFIYRTADRSGRKFKPRSVDEL